jgi:hypothetical protein
MQDTLIMQKQASYMWSWLQEIAIKKMKASKLKEYVAELKVLCKVYHIYIYDDTLIFTWTKRVLNIKDQAVRSAHKEVGPNK